MCLGGYGFVTSPLSAESLQNIVESWSLHQFLERRVQKVEKHPINILKPCSLGAEARVQPSGGDLCAGGKKGRERRGKGELQELVQLGS